MKSHQKSDIYHKLILMRRLSFHQVQVSMLSSTRLKELQGFRPKSRRAWKMQLNQDQRNRIYGLSSYGPAPATTSPQKCILPEAMTTTNDVEKRKYYSICFYLKFSINKCLSLLYHMTLNLNLRHIL